METKFCICRHCGNLASLIHDAGVPLMCCGQKMEVLKPNATDAAGEKHLPVVSVKGGTVHVNVGAVGHPMVEEHAIEWIYVQTRRGGQYKCLKPDEAAAAAFVLEGDEAVAVYAYCNLHGLWTTKL